MRPRTFSRWPVLAAVVLAGALSVALAPGGQATGQSPATGRWFKGNTHTHTLNSDGDSTPDDVVRWYRENRYHFLVLTDHNFLTDVEALQALHGASERFLVIRGEEVTDTFGELPLHVNGLNLATEVQPQGGSSVVDVLQRDVDAIRGAGGIPHINHPYFRWAVTAAELGAVKNTKLFEIFNGHPEINMFGGGGVPGLEEAWDAILTNGTMIYGIAVDDAHTFKQPGNPNVAGPGRGWVMVRAERLDARLIMEALERGDFYASTGVELADYTVSAHKMTITVKPTTFSKYRIQFFGKGGVLLKESTDTTASYDFTGREGYVRAKVVESNGRIAWAQPVAVK
jgi:hypothetical protein